VYKSRGPLSHMGLDYSHWTPARERPSYMALRQRTPQRWSRLDEIERGWTGEGGEGL
jgi:hypothetical protein